MSEDEQTTRAEFGDAVNMTPKQLREWLDTDEAHSVGQDSGDGEATGHKQGRRILELLDTKKDDLTDDDVQQMRRVVSYVHRHLSQRPDKDVTDTPWRYSLMNWGHDPLEKGTR